ncbi:MAG: stalk domain-containing protein [Clostridiales bacterium]|jgi:hypothetical protein|nr:stalk domain-containing protein [Eubacteriales bacterium]MDH7566489.1 stalk domain-containing protein [Clostridiales bacterium]
MKRWIIWALICTLISAALSQPVLAQPEQPETISVYVDGLPVAFDAPPVIRNDRALVPFRAVAEALNIGVEWDASTKTVSAHDRGTSVVLRIDGPETLKNGEEVPLDAPPTIIGNRTMIPLRFFGEAFGCSITWDAAAKEVRMASPAREMTVVGFYALGVPGESSSWEDLFGKPYPGKAEGNTALLSGLAFGWYSMDKQGTLLSDSSTGWRKPDGWENVLEASREYKLKTEMVVNMTDTGGAIRSLLSDKKAVKKAVDGIAAEAKLYQGVNLDFEGLGWRDEEEERTAVQRSFSSFVELLSARLKQDGVKLTLTLHPPNSAYGGYDYKALGQTADRIIIMAYDYNPQPAPEPVDKVIEAVEEAKSQVPAEKLLLGISASSETPGTISTKVGIAKKYGLDGIALWRLGLLHQDMWSALGKAVKARK